MLNLVKITKSYKMGDNIVHALRDVTLTKPNELSGGQQQRVAIAR